tara:strand:+ start:203 stop:1051 length:849 start_codon:yes stop_codon:yes gene_type:complete
MNNIDPQYIHQSGRHKGQLKQSALQVKGIFKAGQVHPKCEQIVFKRYEPNKTQKWQTSEQRLNKLEKQKTYNKYYKKENKAAHQTYMSEYRTKNKERILKQQRGYKIKNKDACDAKQKEWLRKNKTQKNIKNAAFMREYVKTKKGRAARRTYRAKTKDIPYIKLRKNLSGNVRAALKYNKTNKSTKTTKLIGCSIQHLKNHIESLFIEGMSWNNMGRGGWHIDHIIPCAFFSAFDLSKPSIQKLCFHYTNLQPMWESNNCKKSNNLPPILAITILNTLTTHH